MKELFIATNNPHKTEEIKEILKSRNFNVDLLCPKDFNDRSEPVEDGNSYKENAYIKAKYYYDKYHYPTLADDSGISIRYLNYEPNIHSARFLETDDYIEKNNKILDLMRGVKDRYAAFECCLCFIDENKAHYFEGINEGEISLEPKGDEGFGYDTIFLIPKYNKTEAELGNDYKNANSHRAKALRKWVEYLEK